MRKHTYYLHGDERDLVKIRELVNNLKPFETCLVSIRHSLLSERLQRRDPQAYRDAMQYYAALLLQERFPLSQVNDVEQSYAVVSTSTDPRKRREPDYFDDLNEAYAELADRIFPAEVVECD